MKNMVAAKQPRWVWIFHVLYADGTHIVSVGWVKGDNIFNTFYLSLFKCSCATFGRKYSILLNFGPLVCYGGELLINLFFGQYLGVLWFQCFHNLLL
jgi:hypothetical protein